MSSPGPPQKATVQSRPRRARIVLRGGEVVEGEIYLNEGQALSPYLGTRKGGWVNIVKATWLAENETHSHAVLQADHILLALSLDGDIPMHGSTAGAATRDVVIALEDASHVRGTLHLLDKQRLSDYLHSCGKFLPVLNATRTPSNEHVGDCAVNCMAVRVIRDAQVFEPGTMEFAPDAAAEARMSVQIAAIPDGPAPVNEEVVRHDSGSIQVITEGRVPDRRAGRSYTSPTGSQPLAVTEPAAMELTGAQNELADTLASIPEHVARKLGVIPLSGDSKILVIAISDPSSMEIEQQLGFVTRKRLQFQVAPPSDIRGALDWHYKGSAPG